MVGGADTALAAAMKIIRLGPQGTIQRQAGASRSGQGPILRCPWARVWQLARLRVAAALRLRHSGEGASRLAGGRLVGGPRVRLACAPGWRSPARLSPGSLETSRPKVDRGGELEQTSEAIEAHARRYAKHASSQPPQGLASRDGGKLLLRSTA